jgi:hypothetical protein
LIQEENSMKMLYSQVEAHYLITLTRDLTNKFKKELMTGLTNTNN